MLKTTFEKIWSDMICLGRPYHFSFFKGCLSQILLGPFLNTFTHIIINFAVACVWYPSGFLKISCQVCRWRWFIRYFVSINRWITILHKFYITVFWIIITSVISIITTLNSRLKWFCVSMFLLWYMLPLVFSLLKSVTLTGPNIFISTFWYNSAFDFFSSLCIHDISPSKPRPRYFIFVLYDIIQFIKSSTCFSCHPKFFLDFLLVKVVLVDCSQVILNSVIFCCACVVETKSRSAEKMHSDEKIFPRLTEVSVS